MDDMALSADVVYGRVEKACNIYGMVSGIPWEYTNVGVWVPFGWFFSSAMALSRIYRGQPN
eukprot:3333179-Ditylum_brightwellii.AAC.1